jgi:hypothetical protein
MSHPTVTLGIEAFFDARLSPALLRAYGRLLATAWNHGHVAPLTLEFADLQDLLSRNASRLLAASSVYHYLRLLREAGYLDWTVTRGEGYHLTFPRDGKE